jgi:hypothetical protein
MSGWRVLLQELGENGNWIATRAFNGGALESSSFCGLLYVMLEQGMVERRRDRQNSPVEWRITQRGRDVLDGRIVFVVRRVNGMRNSKRRPASRPVATWLASLPRPGEVQL